MTNNRPRTIYELLVASAERAPESTAITFVDDLHGIKPPARQTHSQLLSSIHRSVNMIRSLTGKSHPVVSLLLPNIPQAQTLLWAAETAGIANPLNPLLSDEALFQLMAKAQTDIIFALSPSHGAELWEKAARVAKRLPGRPACISVYGPTDEPGYDSEVLHYDDEPLRKTGAPTAEDIAAYYHTGGTTGTPKLACHTHANQLAAAAAVIDSMQLTGTDIAINGLPIFHVAGAIVNSLAILGAGGELVLPTIAGFRNPEVIRYHWDLVERLGVTISSGIPTSMTAMLDAPTNGADISTLRFLLSGGAPVPLKLHELAHTKAGQELYQAYGMTECSGVIALPDLSGPAVWGSVGKIKPPVEARIEDGEVCVRSPMVFQGYLGQKSPVSNDGWLRTGDLGHIDTEGNLFITGRTKDLIIRSGHNIDPALIESCLEQHPSVGMAAAIGAPDEYAGELPVAYVQLRAGAEATCEELRQYAAEHIAERAACPKKVIILQALPITAVGKIFKPKLRENITELLLHELLSERIEQIGVESRHTEKGELVVRLWNIPSGEEQWCGDQLRRLNLRLEELTLDERAHATLQPG
ncbi:AMP-binding protein [Pseudomonas sp. TTU2014-105ASC]|nr:AMP-binding protein [Pseudomonas sp. TTU2014-105ASC]